MPHDYRNTVELFYQAYARKDLATALELLDPQVELHAAENFIYAKGTPYIGPDAIHDGIFARLDEDWENFTAVPEEILGAGEVVIARGRYRGVFRATGTPINAEFVHVFRFKDGKIAMWQSYTDTAQFKEAALGPQWLGAAQ
jgi:ketosteroid isomerase-like protein